MTKKETAVIVCPGRGTYNAAELGYLYRHHSQKSDFIAQIDKIREDRGQVSISDLDRLEKFSMRRHGTGDNASLLIYACAVADFLDAREKYDIVAVTGNSMGWYLSLACAGALSLQDGAHLVNEMGSLMHNQGKGGQIVYPVVDSNWRQSADRIQLVKEVLVAAAGRSDIEVQISIRLGGMIVFAADDAGLKFLMEKLPTDDRFPMQLNNHAAFHSCILDHIVPEAQARLSQDMFNRPSIPMIDGRGQIWTPHSTDIEKLYHYTLGHQINCTYDFSKAIEVSVKEFAPDKVIVTGPGTTMGAPVAQALIEQNWRFLDGKETFKKLQADDPYVLSMGIEEQRTAMMAD